MALLPPWLYNHARPVLFGLPFFYWYQLAWVVVTSLLLAVAIFMTREHDDAG
jgi:hypothetical protein